MKNKIIDNIKLNKIIIIVRKLETSKLIPVAEALYNGGGRLIEVTFDANGEFSEDYTAEQIELLSKHFKDKIYVGAGTVLTVNQVEKAYRAGAKYIISPNVDREVIEKTVELGMVSIPGALTPSEIQSAHMYGADFVKLFPASVLGTDYIKAITSPLNHINLLAVGGIDENNIKDYLSAGIKGVGIGSNVIKKDLIKEGKFDELTALVKKYVDRINY